MANATRLTHSDLQCHSSLTSLTRAAFFSFLLGFSPFRNALIRSPITSDGSTCLKASQTSPVFDSDDRRFVRSDFAVHRALHLLPDLRGRRDRVLHLIRVLLQLELILLDLLCIGAQLLHRRDNVLRKVRHVYHRDAGARTWQRRPEPAPPLSGHLFLMVFKRLLQLCAILPDCLALRGTRAFRRPIPAQRSERNFSSLTTYWRGNTKSLVSGPDCLPTQSRPEYAGHRRPRRFLAALRAGHEQSRPFSSGLLHPQQVRPSGQPAACADAQGSVPRLHHVETLVAEFSRDPVRGEAVAQTFKEADMRIMPENVNLDAPTSVFVLRPARET